MQRRTGHNVLYLTVAKPTPSVLHMYQITNAARVLEVGIWQMALAASEQQSFLQSRVMDDIKKGNVTFLERDSTILCVRIGQNNWAVTFSEKEQFKLQFEGLQTFCVLCTSALLSLFVKLGQHF